KAGDRVLSHAGTRVHEQRAEEGRDGPREAQTQASERRGGVGGDARVAIRGEPAERFEVARSSALAERPGDVGAHRRVEVAREQRERVATARLSSQHLGKFAAIARCEGLWVSAPSDPELGPGFEDGIALPFSTAAEQREQLWREASIVQSSGRARQRESEREAILLCRLLEARDERRERTGRRRTPKREPRRIPDTAVVVVELVEQHAFPRSGAEVSEREQRRGDERRRRRVASNTCELLPDTGGAR